MRARTDVLRTDIAPLLAVVALVLVACTAPIPDRPREGAPVGANGQPVSKADENTTPPTLSPPTPGGVSLATPGQLSPAGSPVGSPSPVASPSPLAIGGYVIVNTDGAGANMRSGPSTGSPVITTVAEGSAVEVIGDPVTSEGRAWRQIRSGGHDGWVVDVVVRAGAPFSAPPPAPAAPKPSLPTTTAPRPTSPLLATPRPAAPPVAPTARPR